MVALVATIHVFRWSKLVFKTWMLGTSPSVTAWRCWKTGRHSTRALAPILLRAPPGLTNAPEPDTMPARRPVRLETI
jgi:hypothetical protein